MTKSGVPKSTHALIERLEKKALACEDAGADAQARVWRLAEAEVLKWAAEVDDALLTVQEAAAESGLSEAAIRNRLRTKALPNYGEPYKPLVRRGDLPREPGFAALHRMTG